MTMEFNTGLAWSDSGVFLTERPKQSFGGYDLGRECRDHHPKLVWKKELPNFNRVETVSMVKV
jgi:hypothetical protein